MSAVSQILGRLLLTSTFQLYNINIALEYNPICCAEQGCENALCGMDWDSINTWGLMQTAYLAPRGRE